MPPRFLLLLFLALSAADMATPLINSTNATTVNSTNVALNTTSPNDNSTAPAAVNSTAPINNNAVVTKARFLCTYNRHITRVVFIDKKTHTFLALRAQIASFFPNKPAKFVIRYKILNQDGHDAELVYVHNDVDVRNLMALHEALARVSSNPAPIMLNVMSYLLLQRDFWMLLGIFLVLLALVGVCVILEKRRSDRV